MMCYQRKFFAKILPKISLIPNSIRNNIVSFKSSQKYLKFIDPAILNQILNLFQGLALWTKRDAEPMLNQVQHKVHDNKGFEMLEEDSQT
jgi:hypothetical protein